MNSNASTLTRLSDRRAPPAFASAEDRNALKIFKLRVILGLVALLAD